MTWEMYFFHTFANTISDLKGLSVIFSLGFIMTVSRPCYFGNLLLGVVGVDVNLAYILEDVTYYQDSLASYTFLIDNKGMVMHAQMISWSSVPLKFHLNSS